jgi:hypothetical protein
MSIYPQGVDPHQLRFKWQTAAINVPVPDDLTDKKDQQEWETYLGCLSLSQQLSKFGQALDEFHTLMRQTPDPDTAPKAEGTRLYSKWLAAHMAGTSLFPRLHHAIEDFERKITSDIGMIAFLAAELHRDIQSPEAKAWEERLETHDKIVPDNFCRFVSKVEAGFSDTAPSPN